MVTSFDKMLPSSIINTTSGIHCRTGAVTMQTVCVSSNWPTVETLHPRQLDIFVHGWQDDCPPPDVNGAAPAVTAPAVPGQGVGACLIGVPFCSGQHCRSLRDCYGDAPLDVFTQSLARDPSAIDLRDEFFYDVGLDWSGACLDAPDRMPSGSVRQDVDYDGQVIGMAVVWRSTLLYC